MSSPNALFWPRVVCFLYVDHLGSTSLITDTGGATVSETRYLPYGQVYWQSGASQTDFGFTGQRMDGFGLMDYNARYYDSLLGRFVSPDTIIPQSGNPQGWDRYSYVYSNPGRYTDPTGNKVCDGNGFDGCEGDLINNYSVAKKHWSPFPAAKNVSIPSRPDSFTPENNPEWFPNNYQGTDYSPYWEKYVIAKNIGIYNKYRDKLFFCWR